MCREIHAGMTSKERNKINYLFLEPVDPNFFPDYLKIVKRPMDLRTLKEHLDKGTYAKKEEFYADAKLIFDNAVLFNKDRDSVFVVDLAKSMSKAFEKLRKTSERKAARLAAASAAAEGSGSSGSGGGKQKASKEGEKKQEKKEGGGEKKKKKINIKLKRQKSTSSMGDISKASSNDSAGGGEVSTTTDSKPAKKAKAKLKLKLSTGSDAKKKLKLSNGSDAKKAKSSTPKSSDATKFEAAQMNPTRRAQCAKIISSLKRREPAAYKWFHKPVTDPFIVKDYKEKISNPMDFSTISSK